MRNTLYVANLPESATEDLLREIFQEYGDVQSIELGTNERFGTRAALVTFPAEKAATRANHGLNGYLLDRNHLSISYPDVREEDYARGLSAKQRETAEAVAKELGEEWRKPVRRIHTMILLCGHSFVLHLVNEAKEIYNGDGMLTYDGSRKRNLGGVFFTLANHRMADPVYRIVHLRGGKLPNYQPQDDAPINHLVLNPKEF